MTDPPTHPIANLSSAERELRRFVINAAAHAYAYRRDYGDETLEDCGAPASVTVAADPAQLPPGAPQHVLATDASFHHSPAAPEDRGNGAL